MEEVLKCSIAQLPMHQMVHKVLLLWTTMDNHIMGHPMVLPKRIFLKECPMVLPKRIFPKECPMVLPKRISPMECPMVLHKRICPMYHQMVFQAILKDLMGQMALGPFWFF